VVGPGNLADGLKDLVLTQQQRRMAELQASLDLIAALVADIDAATELNRQEQVRQLRIQLGGAMASVTEQIAVAVGPGSAIAQQLTELTAAVDNVDASLKARFIVGVTPDGALAAYDLEATAEGATAGLRVVARDDGLGDISAEVQIIANQFFVTGSGLDATPVFLVDTTGATPKIILSGDLIADGSITAAKILVDSLDALSIDAGTLKAGRLTDPDETRMEINLSEGWWAIYSGPAA